MWSIPEFLELLNGFGAENSFPAAPKELYEPCQYVLDLGGKRLRPALLLMGYELFAPDVETALPAAWAIELFHNFSLIHDDIMDQAPLRRGKPTVHTRWNLSTGILSGDAMLIQAYRFLAAFPHTAAVPDLLRVFNRVAMEVCEGQQYDMNFETRSDVSLDEYIRMIELKTAVLLGAALEMGGLCAAAPREDVNHLYEFGRLAGIAFQIQDDLLDTYGDPEKFGKQVGGDILQNKKTYLVLKVLETAGESDRAELRKWLSSDNESNPEEKIAAVRALFDRNRIPELAFATKQDYQARAFHHLDAVQVPEQRKNTLRKTVDELLVRAF